MKRETTKDKKWNSENRTYFKITYSTKIEILKDMDKFLDVENLQKVNKDEANNLNRFTTISYWLFAFQIKKKPVQMD